MEVRTCAFRKTDSIDQLMDVPYGVQCAALLSIGVQFRLQIGLKLSSRTRTAAVSNVLSRIVSTANERCFPSGLGMYTRRTGSGR
jgi:hypothetical protein